MATTLTRFDVELPFYDPTANPTQYNAVQTFLTNIASIAYGGLYYQYNMYAYNSSGYVRESNFTSGFITSAQQATALGYLNTLNAALGFNVLCIVYVVTVEP